MGILLSGEEAAATQAGGTMGILSMVVIYGLVFPVSSPEEGAEENAGHVIGAGDR